MTNHNDRSLLSFDGNAVSVSQFQVKRLGLIYLVWQLGPDHATVRSLAKIAKVDVQECEYFLRLMHQTADTEQSFAEQMDIIRALVEIVATRDMLNTSGDVVA